MSRSELPASRAGGTEVHHPYEVRVTARAFGRRPRVPVRCAEHLRAGEPEADLQHGRLRARVQAPDIDLGHDRTWPHLPVLPDRMQQPVRGVGSGQRRQRRTVLRHRGRPRRNRLPRCCRHLIGAQASVTSLADRLGDSGPDDHAGRQPTGPAQVRSSRLIMHHPAWLGQRGTRPPDHGAPWPQYAAQYSMVVRNRLPGGLSSRITVHRAPQAPGTPGPTAPPPRATPGPTSHGFADHKKVNPDAILTERRARWAGGRRRR